MLEMSIVLKLCLLCKKLGKVAVKFISLSFQKGREYTCNTVEVNTNI